MSGREPLEGQIKWAERTLGPTVLYRLFDADGELLYVGISKSVLARFAQHARGKDWIKEVSTIRLQWQPDRDTALEAEAAAIRAERPKYNLAHSDETTLAQAALRGDTDNPRAHAALEREQLRLAGRTHW